MPYLEDDVMNGSELQTVLGGLIDVCKESEGSYRFAAAHILGTDLTAQFLLRHYALQRSGFANQLQAQLRSLGYQPAFSELAIGSTEDDHVSNPADGVKKDKQILLRVCIRCETLAEANYALALRSGLPGYLSILVKQQYIQIREARNRMRAMEREPSMDNTSAQPWVV